MLADALPLDIIPRELHPNPDKLVVNIPLSTTEHSLRGKKLGQVSAF
jgi:hypothetical protein